MGSSFIRSKNSFVTDLDFKPQFSPTCKNFFNHVLSLSSENVKCLFRLTDNENFPLQRTQSEDPSIGENNLQQASKITLMHFLFSMYQNVMVLLS